MLKRVDTAVYTVIGEVARGEFKAGTRTFGLKDKGVDYAVDANNEALVASHRDMLEQIRTRIISGKIQVPDFYKSGKKN